MGGGYGAVLCVKGVLFQTYGVEIPRYPSFRRGIVRNIVPAAVKKTLSAALRCNLIVQP